MTEQNIIFDTNTGLPQLPVDHIFVVKSYGYGLGYGIELDGNDDQLVYAVSIEHLQPQEYFPDVPVYRKNIFGFKVLSHVTQGEPKPRTTDGYVTDHVCLVEVFEEPITNFVVTKEVKERYDYWVKQYKRTAGKKIQLYRVQELNSENIKKAAIRCFLNWEDERKRMKDKEDKLATQRELELKYCGQYPPKGINYG